VALIFFKKLSMISKIFLKYFLFMNKVVEFNRYNEYKEQLSVAENSTSTGPPKSLFNLSYIKDRFWLRELFFYPEDKYDRTKKRLQSKKI